MRGAAFHRENQFSRLAAKVTLAGTDLLQPVAKLTCKRCAPPSSFLSPLSSLPEPWTKSVFPDGDAADQ
jgi:hypothetical protein